AAEIINKAADPDANIIFGTVTDPAMGNEVKITLIATGFDQNDAGYGRGRGDLGGGRGPRGPRQPPDDPQPLRPSRLGGSYGGDAEDAVVENRARLARSLGFAPDRLITTPMVHGKNVLVVDQTTAADALSVRADILVTREPGYLLMLRVADCVPILLADASAGV